MIRVLVVDDQRFVRQSLKALLEQKSDIEVVGTAADGQSAIEQVEVLHPDVVLIDLYMPVMDGVTAIRSIAQRFTTTKALVCSGYKDDASIVEALRAGAKGYLLKGASAEDLAVAVQAVHKGCSYLGPGLLEKLEQTVSRTPLSVPALPSAGLQKWTYWVAHQVLNQWREQQPQTPISAEMIVSELGLASVERVSSLLRALGRTAVDTSISAELIQRFRDLQRQQQQQKLVGVRLYEWLEQESATLARWFRYPSLGSTTFSLTPVDTDGCLVQLQVNSQRLQTQLREQFQGYLSELMQGSGPSATLQCLEELDQSLNKAQTDYESLRQECLYQENAAWRAYQTLSTRLTDPSWQKQAASAIDQEAPLRALSLAYGHKLKSEIYMMASQCVRELIRHIQGSVEQVKKADNLLASWQSWLAKHCSVQSIFVPLLSLNLIEHLNASALLRELEHQQGQPLPQWGDLSTAQHQALFDQLLAQVEQLTTKWYLECCQAALMMNPTTEDVKGTVELAATTEGAQQLLTPSGMAALLATPEWTPQPEWVPQNDLEQSLQDLEKLLQDDFEALTASAAATEVDPFVTLPMAEIVDEAGTVLSSDLPVFGEFDTYRQDNEPNGHSQSYKP